MALQGFSASRAVEGQTQRSASPFPPKVRPLPTQNKLAAEIAKVCCDRLLLIHLSNFKLEFHDVDTDTDTDILARILADTSDTRDFLKLFPWQAERHADILARMSVSVSASWNGSFIKLTSCGLASQNGFSDAVLRPGQLFLSVPP